MTLSETNKLAKHICRLLKTTEITFPLGRTPKGNLGITFNQNDDDFTIMLDSVPLSTASLINDENNIELKEMVKKYWFDPTFMQPSLKEYPTQHPVEDMYVIDSFSHAKVEEEPVSKPKGRPKKVTHGNTSTEESS